MLKSIQIMFVMGCCVASAIGADWPTWRGDAARRGYTTDSLPKEMSRHWSWQPAHPPQSAWPRDERMSFDRTNHVVVAHDMVYFGSSTDCKVYAIDAATGELKWSFFTDGPIRFAPVVWKDHIFVVSDDGYLYCLDAVRGLLIDRWRGGARDDRVLGNGRIVSRWPARGGPVVYDGVLYWGAGIWQSEQVFIHAMNLETREIIWRNDSSGGIDMPQPHGGAQAKSGVSAQGYLLANKERLFVPTGRAVPAAFTRASGEFEYYRLQENTRRGGTVALLEGSLLYNGGYTYRTDNGELVSDPINGAVAVYSDGIVHGAAGQLRALKPTVKEVADRKGELVKVPTHEVLWQLKGVPSGTALIGAGNTIVTSQENKLAAIDVKSQKVIWTDEVDDIAYGLAAADGRLYVSTASGTIHCYAASGNAKPVEHRAATESHPYGLNAVFAAAAVEIVERTGVTEGYCVDLGCGDGALAYELAKRTKLHIVALDPDPKNVAQARRKLDACGLYGSRVTVQQGDLAKTSYPKYFANLVVSARALSEGAGVVDPEEAFRLQRPYGGIACIGGIDSMKVATRGPLAGAGQWTHLYSNAANTLCSTDDIKGPLSMLWFRDVDLELPQRHGRGPSPLFHDGRLFAEGLDGLRAVDAYNGRSLWHFEQEGILDAYNADHLAGTAVTGSNMCIAGDSVFLRNKDRCYRIDAATGSVKQTYVAPKQKNDEPGTWGYIACEDGILFGSLSNTEHVVRHAYIRADAQMKQQYSESTLLFAMDVESGEVLWRHDAQNSLRNNTIAIGGGKLFVIDRELALDDLLSRAPARRGEKPKLPPIEHRTGELIALDAKTGKQSWYSIDNIFGTTVAYSAEHDVVLMCYQPTSFRLPSEVGGKMTAFRASTGERLWDSKANYKTRPLINDRTIIAWPSSIDLLTGEASTFSLAKSYGCGQLSGSKNLLMFRSGTLGYLDTTRAAGTENFGGLRPGCWINAFPVGGLVLVPDASAGCKCSYQNRSWVALQGSD
ncbi:MAG: PQQ-binding-like beta-propeller repeat protein [Planctomycetes bacterium]|nr:PQQ-binding-like beta-propeller repeat protein [Planctomycetota bacterium]